jgi:penicillin-binding protein 1A
MQIDKILFWLWFYWQRTIDFYAAVNSWFNKLKENHFFKYHFSLLVSSYLNLLLLASLVALAFSQVAFKEFNENILYKQQLSVTFYDRDGDLIGRRGIRLDDSLQLEDYPKYFIDAVLATEDRRFYSHWGIDPIGTIRALMHNNRNVGSIQGGSSITQQLAKNLFLSNERTFERKIKEAFLAVALEFNLSKEEILKLYLDRAYMGGGSYGATEAARHYFNKSAKEISVSEAAILAGLFKAPSRFSPEANPNQARKRWLTVLENLRVTRKISEDEYEEALLYPPQANVYKDTTAANYYLDWAWKEIKKLEAKDLLGDNKVLHVTTTLDLKLQRKVEEIITKQLEEADNKFDVDQAAIVTMTSDGAVVSMIGGNDYRDSAFNRATNSLRQPGSSFKPFVYAAAVDAGILDKDTIVTDKPTCIGRWCPKNYNGGYVGSMPAWQAMAQSINTIPVQLSIQLGKDESSVKAGRAKIIDMAKIMGIESDMYDTQSLPIGSAEVTPMDMATGYAVLANGGYRAKAFAITTVKNTAGNIVYQHEASKQKVVSDRVVSNLNFMLHRVVEQGTATAARIQGHSIAGKTGTTNAYKDAWFIGYTGSLVTAIWMGNDDNASSVRMTGGSLPARTWRMIMEEAVKTFPSKPLLGLNTPERIRKPTNLVPQNTKPIVNTPQQFVPPVAKERNFFERLFNLD